MQLVIQTNPGSLITSLINRMQVANHQIQFGRQEQLHYLCMQADNMKKS